MSLPTWPVRSVLQSPFQGNSTVLGEGVQEMLHLCCQMQQALLQGAGEAGEFGLCLLGSELLRLHPAPLHLGHSPSQTLPSGPTTEAAHSQALPARDHSHPWQEARCQTRKQASVGRCAHHELLLKLF